MKGKNPMKKLIKLTALLLIVTTMLFCFASCTDNGKKDNNNDGETITEVKIADTNKIVILY